MIYQLEGSLPLYSTGIAVNYSVLAGRLSSSARTRGRYSSRSRSWYRLIYQLRIFQFGSSRGFIPTHSSQQDLPCGISLSHARQRCALLSQDQQVDLGGWVRSAPRTLAVWHALHRDLTERYRFSSVSLTLQSRQCVRVICLPRAIAYRPNSNAAVIRAGYGE